MIIKTITCHNVYNYGASLQAYALQHFLIDLGNCVEIINYCPDYLKHYKLFDHVSPKYNRPIIRGAYSVAKLPGRIAKRLEQRKKAFDNFTKEYLRLSKEYRSLEELKKNPPKADIYIAGSDQIWNPELPNGHDPAFFLEFAPLNAKRVSYAASFSVAELQVDVKINMKKELSSFDMISVREQSGVAILRSLGLNHGVKVLDPVFLLPPDAWKAMALPVKHNEKYILVYDFDKSNQIREAAGILAKRYDCKIYSFQKIGYEDRCFFQTGPREFLYLLMNAEVVLSNSFHATAFSTIFHKEFWVFPRNMKINSRMSDFLDEIGLSSRYISNASEMSICAIDYTAADSKLQAEIQQSIKFLRCVCEDDRRS